MSAQVVQRVFEISQVVQRELVVSQGEAEEPRGTVQGIPWGLEHMVERIHALVELIARYSHITICVDTR